MYLDIYNKQLTFIFHAQTKMWICVLTVRCLYQWVDISFTVGVHDKRNNSQEWFLKGAPEELTDYMCGVIELITRLQTALDNWIKSWLQIMFRRVWYSELAVQVKVQVDPLDNINCDECEMSVTENRTDWQECTFKEAEEEEESF